MDEQNTIETPEQNYIDALNNLKQNTVSKEEYNKVVADNKKLVESLCNSGMTSTEEPETRRATDEEVQYLHDKLMTSNSCRSDLELLDTALKLRAARLSRGEPDGALIHNHERRLTDADVDSRMYIIDGLQHMVDYSDGDSKLFISERQRCCK